MVAYTIKNTDAKKSKSAIKCGLVIASVFLILIIAVGSGIFGYQQANAGKIYQGVTIGHLAVGGQTGDQVLSQLKSIEDQLRNEGIKFNYQSNEIVVHPIVISVTDPDLAKEILIFHWSDSVDQALAVGRGGNWGENMISQIKLLTTGYEVPINYYLNQEELLNILITNFSKFENPPVNAKLTIVGDQYTIEPERSGHTFDYQSTIKQLVENINNLKFKPIALELMIAEPTIKKENTGSVVNSLENILAINSIKLTVDNRWWLINKEQIINWLEFQTIDDELVVGLNQEKVLEFLTPIAEVVNVEARDAKFKLTDNRVTEFQASQDGKTLNLEESYQLLNQQVIAGKTSDLELVIEVESAKVATTDLNDLGIKELLGRGTSNFAGSPVNRRHNIGVGASTLNGILIEPNEEFSLLKALGEISASTGYRQELVIKGDRTIPEYGGGLCQIGTTTFRAALAAGLPITQRRNHSYRVGYYEPPVGMDATIYDPFPDFRFINDTGHHILFITRIEGDEAIFEFYGTSDGRVASTTEPVVYNIVGPGEPRYIETDELPPGEKRRVERAHNGASASFTYSVAYPGGEIKEEIFESHYVPWKETWLVGRQPSTTDEVSEAVVQ